MNDIETNTITNFFGNEKNKTMEDYFDSLSKDMEIDVNIIKNEFKKFYPDETDWSF
tara:strand:+ start:6177 stop:6344 length:168 start_codon:yes stop_codon:yes gene_type:complete